MPHYIQTQNTPRQRHHTHTEHIFRPRYTIHNHLTETHTEYYIHRADIHTHIPHYTHIHTQAQNTYLDMYIPYYKKVRVAYIQNTRTHTITLRPHITLHILYNTAYHTYPTHACTTHIPRNICILLYIHCIAHGPESMGKFITHTYTHNTHSYICTHIHTYAHTYTHIYAHTQIYTHTPN